MEVDPNAEEDSRLLKFVQSVAISPKDARKLVAKYRRQSESKHKTDTDSQHESRVAQKIIKRYSKLAASVGGLAALPGVIPGIGQAVAVLGGGTADVGICMKLQVDMCVCLAANYGYEIESQDAQHLSYLIAAGGAIEQTSTKVGTQMASKAGVQILRQNLKGAALQAVKQAFKKVGVTFTRKALEKAIPFGIGVGVGGAANYALTLYVGTQAKGVFLLDSGKF